MAVLPGVMDGIGACKRVQGTNTWFSHQQFAGAVKERVKNGLRRDAAIEQLDRFVTGVPGRTFTNGLEHFGRGLGVWRSVQPAGADLFRFLQIAAIGTIRRQVGFGWIFLCAATIQQRVSKRAQNRLGVLPSDGVQGAKAVRYVDGFVSEIAKVASAIT